MSWKEIAIFDEVNWAPGPAQLRKSVLSLAGAALFWISIAAWRAGTGWRSFLPWWAGTCALTLTALLLRPMARMLYLAFQVLAAFVQFLVSNVMMVLLFFIVFTPIGTLLRIFRGDPMQFRPGQQTMWKSSTADPGIDRFYHQF